MSVSPELPTISVEKSYVYNIGKMMRCETWQMHHSRIMPSQNTKPRGNFS
jgi:hypothetical protein